MKGYIYKYTFPDGKIYIGQTRRPIEIRHAEHINPSTGPMNPGFWDAYQNVGTPILTILETVENKDLTSLITQLNYKETEYIYRYKAADKDFGYNRKVIATTYSPNVNILKKEYYHLCRQAEDNKRPFFDSLSEKLFNGEWERLTEEEKQFVEGYLDNKNIFTCSKEEEWKEFMLEEALDYAIWLYNEESYEIVGRYIEENAAEIIRKAKQGKIIQQLDMDGNVLREFESQDEIRDAFNISRIDNITNVIKGRQKSAYGYRWRYK